MTLSDTALVMLSAAAQRPDRGIDLSSMTKLNGVATARLQVDAGDRDAARVREGATIAAIMEVTGWQSPPVRGFFAVAVRKHLRGLDLTGLRAAWRSATGRNIPAQVPKHLLFRMLAYRLQVKRFGDLAKDVVRSLDQMAGSDVERTDAFSTLLQGLADRRLRPGTVLMREWQGVQQRVMVLADGFAWQDQIFASLSEAAFAITGTRWNGPRFFGLRDKVRATKQKAQI